jgi:hypothetical protein
VGLKHYKTLTWTPEDGFYKEFEVRWPWSGPLHYADVLERYGPELKVELTTLIEAYTK